MENNLENNSRFFALYWGFKCLRNELLNDNIPAHKVDTSNCKGLPQQYLELTPISQISDEDAIEVAKIVCWEMFQNSHSDPIKIERHGEWLTVWRRRNIHSVDIDFLGYTTCQKEDVEYKRNSTGNTHAIDYLRSRGYALPWMGLSVEQLIEYGWVKLNKG